MEAGPCLSPAAVAGDRGPAAQHPEDRPHRDLFDGPRPPGQRDRRHRPAMGRAAPAHRRRDPRRSRGRHRPRVRRAHRLRRPLPLRRRAPRPLPGLRRAGPERQPAARPPRAVRLGAGHARQHRDGGAVDVRPRQRRPAPPRRRAGGFAHLPLDVQPADRSRRHPRHGAPRAARLAGLDAGARRGRADACRLRFAGGPRARRTRFRAPRGRHQPRRATRHRTARRYDAAPCPATTPAARRRPRCSRRYHLAHPAAAAAGADGQGRRAHGPAARPVEPLFRARARDSQSQRRRGGRRHRAHDAEAGAPRHDQGSASPVTDPRRRLPSVDTLLVQPAIAALVGPHPRSLVVRAVRDALDQARGAGGAEPDEGWSTAVAGRLARAAAPSFVPVINATGVVLHTNLGRATLAGPAIEAMCRAAEGYTTLEYDIGRGARGSRHRHCRDLLVELTGAEDAIVVNNAAGGVLLALAALAREGGGEAIVSRGELVEIGGSFRIPDVMARSGARLVEVGTTNRTHLKDYEQALTHQTRVLLKVHRSNFQLSGFTADVEVAELAQLARAGGAASVYDVGSGLLLDLTPWGLAGEPTVPAAVATGVDLVICSGDKLLGGPQAGILVGRAAAIAACRQDPLARAVRSDKFTLAALEATLALYRDPERARREIPVLRMLTEDVDNIRRRGEALREGVGGEALLIEGDSEVGGGSFPGTTLKTWLVALAPDHLTADVLAERLRSGDPPVIARIHDGRVVLDPRTIFPDQVAMAARAAHAALGAG